MDENHITDTPITHASKLKLEGFCLGAVVRVIVNEILAEMKTMERELSVWRQVAKPYAKTPKGLEVEIQKLEELVSKSRTQYGADNEKSEARQI